MSDPATPFRSVVNRYVLCLDVTPQPFGAVLCASDTAGYSPRFHPQRSCRLPYPEAPPQPISPTRFSPTEGRAVWLKPP